MVDDKAFMKDYLNKRKQNTDANFFEKIKPLLESMSCSNGCKYYKTIDRKIGIVSDKFLFVAYDGIADIRYITPDNYKEHTDLDVFIVVSTWRGLNSEWNGLAYFDKEEKKNQLYEIIHYYRTFGVKIVFYSKEDPTNYNLFVPIAKKCDYIFTTAEECIESYKKDCSNQNVFLLEFGVNPLHHNPIGSRGESKLSGFIFAGSWYKKYPKRNADMVELFDGIIQSNMDLKIIDRNYHIRRSSSYFYPEKYLTYISPAIDHEHLLKVYKLFDWTVNLNTIQYSNTMYASRVYDMQAMGTVILSNYSVGINNKFPNVIMVDKKAEVKRILNSFTERDMRLHQNEGIRNVMTSETTFDRLNYLLSTIGINSYIKKRKVLVVAQNLDSRTKALFENQSYPYKEIVSENKFTKKLKESFDIIAFWGKNRIYEEYYLEDMINAFKYTSCNYITKSCFYKDESLIIGLEHDYVNIMGDKYRTVFWSDSFTFKQFSNMCKEEKLPGGYSLDRFEYTEFSHSENIGSDDEKKDYKLSVIIPVYNNGKHLLNKCFKSLKRSSIFHDMEIIIVDDGSDDGDTKRIVQRLAREYSNIRYYLYDDTGSGSASRPRNKGFQLSTSPLITYLDPDNEAINDGYSKLYKKINNSNCDLVVGNIIKICDKKVHLNYFKKGYEEIRDTEAYLKNTRFRTQSIQALIVKRDIIENNKLRMVPGALGQDSLFFQELLLNSKRVRVINESIHIYYASVEGSMTNSITKAFFEKYLLLEPERHKRLKEYGVLREYINSRFEIYFDKWYLEKFKRIQDSDLIESAQILYEIYTLYRPKCFAKNPKIKKFLIMIKNKKYGEVKDVLLKWK